MTLATIQFTGVKGGVGTTTAALLTAIACANRTSESPETVIDLVPIDDAARDDVASYTGVPAGDDTFYAAHRVVVNNDQADVAYRIIDAGLVTYPGGVPDDAIRVLVIENSYAALRRARAVEADYDVVVCRVDPARPLSVREIRDVLESTFVVAWNLDPVVARAADAGTLGVGWNGNRIDFASNLLTADDDLLDGTGWDEDQARTFVAKVATAETGPGTFPDVTDVETEHRCPRCGYEWSGRPDPPSAAGEPDPDE